MLWLFSLLIETTPQLWIDAVVDNTATAVLVYSKWNYKFYFDVRK
ncbi:hypothetical protein GLYMA_11G146063v4 [Glycine max]|nr:hypothetical protein GYH30_057327 [Glycine max]KRH29894.2 hypothetical protein GLYMA_11G146063v4 [Glycine max]